MGMVQRYAWAADTAGSLVAGKGEVGTGQPVVGTHWAGTLEVGILLVGGRDTPLQDTPGHTADLDSTPLGVADRWAGSGPPL